MRAFHRKLSVRLGASFLLIVAIAVASTALLSRTLAGGYFDAHLQDMAEDPSMGMMGGSATSPEVLDNLREGFASSFSRAELIAALVSAAAALAVSAYAAMRLLRPLGRIRKATRRMARGAYHERVPLPVEEELAAVAEDVNALGGALEQVEERRVRLISEVAHELRTPLSTIQGYMEGLLDGVFDPSEEIYASTAREAARLRRLAADLGSLAAAEGGSLELRTARVDLASLAAASAERLRPQFDAQDVVLRVDSMPSLPVSGDPDRLSQVFFNIVGNALSYTPAGGEVVVSGSRAGRTAVVRVADTGQGLEEQHLDLIFERFYRADRNRRGGTGIGLTIARRIARLHGGDVVARSPGLGQGSTFEITVPLART